MQMVTAEDGQPPRRTRGVLSPREALVRLLPEDTPDSVQPAPGCGGSSRTASSAVIRGSSRWKAIMGNRWVAILIITGSLALTPILTWGQMGPNPGGGSGMRRGTAPSSSAEPERRDQTGNSKSPAAAAQSKAIETPDGDGMAARGQESPTTSPIFDRERTLLLLLGVGVTAAGFFAYRVIWSRARPRRGPAGFMTEAVLVVDLVDSTHLATHYGNGLAMQARTMLKDRTLAATKGHSLAFAENTGDGYFMTFPSVVNAAQVAITLLRELRDAPPDLSPKRPLDVRVGISYGETLIDAKGARHGAVINRAFRLEGLTRESFAQMEGGLRPEAIPDRNRIFLDEEAAQELRTDGIPMRFLGFCSLKGFSGLHQVHEVLWAAQV